LASLKARPLNLKNPRSSESGGPDLENANSPRQKLPHVSPLRPGKRRKPRPPRRRSVSNNAFPMLHPLANLAASAVRGFPLLVSRYETTIAPVVVHQSRAPKRLSPG
jgi:hypothetical protein